MSLNVNRFFWVFFTLIVASTFVVSPIPDSLGRLVATMGLVILAWAISIVVSVNWGG